MDAWSKVPESVLTGNLVNLGNYDECLEVEVNEQWGSFVGQHCLVVLTLTLGNLTNVVSTPFKMLFLPLGLSTCLPSTCSPAEVGHLLSSHLHMKVTMLRHFCHTQNTYNPLGPADWVAIAVLAMLALLCLVGTVHNLLVTKAERQSRFLMLFSCYKNGQSLFGTKPNTESIDVLHGIRFFSIAWVVLGHTYELAAFHPHVNFLRGNEMIRDWLHLLVTSGVFAVDTFFLLSGLLLSYVFLKGMDAGYPFNLPVFYLHRFFRVVPVLALLVLLQVSLIPRMGGGPMWDYTMVDLHKTNCVNKWWSTLLFIQNYVNPERICVPTSWFLAVDMQVYWTSPIILYLLHKRPRMGLGLTVAACLVGTVVSFQQTYTHNDEPSPIRSIVANDRYYQTHMRFVPWVMGLGCGYLIYRTADWRKRVAVGMDRLSLVTVASGWLLTTVACLGLIIGLHPFEQMSYEYSPTEAATYTSLSHLVWSLGIMWIIFACVSGYGGIANTILTWPGFAPLGRLSFCIYLTHFEVILMCLASTKVPGYFEDFDLVMLYFAYLVLTILLSVVMTLTVESPIIGLEKLLLTRSHTHKSRYNGRSLIETEEGKQKSLTIHHTE